MNRRPTPAGRRVLRYMATHREYLPARISPIIFGLNDRQLRTVLDSLQRRELVKFVPGKVLLTDLGRDELSGAGARRRRIVGGERNGRSRLRAEDIPAIREAYANGVVQRALGAQYGVSPSTIGHVVRRVTWSDVA